MSLVIDIAEGVKAVLNAAVAEDAFSLEFEAERIYIPRFDLETATEELSVQVVPRFDDRTLASRGGDVARAIPIDIGFQKKLTTGLDPSDPAANPELDALMDLVEEVADYLKPGTRIVQRVIVRTTIDPIYIPEHLANASVFTSVITANFKIA